jgi:hypothetical protein
MSQEEGRSPLIPLAVVTWRVRRVGGRADGSEPEIAYRFEISSVVRFIEAH